MISRLILTLCLLSLWVCAPETPRTPALGDASGIARRGDYLLIVDDDAAGAYFRFPVRGRSGPLIPIDPRQLELVRLPRAEVAADLEAIDVLADGRVAALSERLRALVGEDGLIAEYQPQLAEFGNRGLEGLAVECHADGSSRVAVLWEGGYPEYEQVPIALHEAAGRVAMSPIILVHDLRRGESGIKVLMLDALNVIELRVPIPPGAPPGAQRFRAPDLVWCDWSSDEGEQRGFIVLLSSQNSAGKREYLYHWLQRFTLDGEPVGEPVDLDLLVPRELKGLNWEGLSWFEEGKSVVTVHERGTRPNVTALVVQLPEAWQVRKVSQASFTHILREETFYYLTGPQQARPPDGKLPAGTRVRLLENAGSYSLVKTEGNVRAYVAADVLKPSRGE